MHRNQILKHMNYLHVVIISENWAFINAYGGRMAPQWRCVKMVKNCCLSRQSHFDALNAFKAQSGHWIWMEISRLASGEWLHLVIMVASLNCWILCCLFSCAANILVNSWRNIHNKQIICFLILFLMNSSTIHFAWLGIRSEQAYAIC